MSYIATTYNSSTTVTSPGWTTASPYWEYTSEQAIRREIEKLYDATNAKMFNAKKKDNHMSTIEKVKAERREKRERAEIEKLYDAYDNHGTVEGWGEGTVARFSWTPPKERNKDGKTYTYAAVWTGDRWYITGPTSGGDYTLETFVDFLVDKRIKPTDIEFFGTSES